MDPSRKRRSYAASMLSTPEALLGLARHPVSVIRGSSRDDDVPYALAQATLSGPLEFDDKSMVDCETIRATNNVIILNPQHATVPADALTSQLMSGQDFVSSTARG